jgi:hypothetical protein
VSADFLAFPLDSAVTDRRYRKLRAVVADGFHRTTFHRFFAERFFLGTFRLFVNVGVAAVVIAFEIGGRGFAAQIAVDALIIDVEFARYVFGVFVRGIGHSFPVKVRLNVRKKCSLRNCNIGIDAPARNRYRPLAR